MPRRRKESVIRDFLPKLRYLELNGDRISFLLFPDGYKGVFRRDDYLVSADNCLAAIFGLAPESWSRYKRLTRPFQRHHLANLTLFILHLGGERNQKVGDSPLYYYVHDVCAGQASRFIALLDFLLARNPISSYRFETSVIPFDTSAHDKLSAADISFVHTRGWSGEEFLKRLITLDYKLIENLTPAHEGTEAQWAPVFMHRPETWRLIINSRDCIVGYWHFVPLFDNELDKAKRGEMVDSEITEDKIRVFAFPGWYDVYFISMEIAAQYRSSGYGLLLSSLLDALFKLSYHDIYICNVYAHAYTAAGVSLCRDLGMKPTAQHVFTGDIYSAHFTDVIQRMPSRQHDSLKEKYRTEWERHAAENKEHS